MDFRLLVPANRFEPLRWVAGILFRDRLGLSIEIAKGEASEILLSAEGGRLTMPSLFPDLHAEKSTWGTQLPTLPLAVLDTSHVPEAPIDDPLPVLFGRPEIEASDGEIRCNLDILGSIFFMLSRFEELVVPERDTHDRFPATASLAWAGGFLYRPLVDEYVEVLFALMKRLWPSLPRKSHDGQVNVSCDVDQPFDSIGSNPIMLMRVLRHEVFLKRRPAVAVQRMANFVVHHFGDRRFDPFYTFDWYVAVCEKHGRRAAFYFIADHSDDSMDGAYDIREPRILALIREINRRGHEIGMHGSYNTYRDGAQIAGERQRLQAACENAEIGADLLGNRQHYLRWDAGETPDHLDAAGLGYDATGSFADRPGFRYGTSHSFAMWSWKRLGPLRLIQKPLVLMEGSILLDGYLGMGHSNEALDLMQTLKTRAMRYGGDFNLLWHNSELLTPKDREFFEALIG